MLGNVPEIVGNAPDTCRNAQKTFEDEKISKSICLVTYCFGNWKFNCIYNIALLCLVRVILKGLYEMEMSKLFRIPSVSNKIYNGRVHS